MSKSVCFVSSDVYGPIFNGGIGTYVYHAAKVLAAEFGHDVSILLTRPQERGTKAEWVAFYRKLGISLYYLDDIPPRFPALLPHGEPAWYLERSDSVDRFLLGHAFDVVNFQDWNANGFIPIARKRGGLGHRDTLFTLTMHSPTEWQEQGNKRFLPGTMDVMRQNWCERYCCRMVDRLIAPSQHMFDWAEANGWVLAEKRSVIPYVIAADAAPAEVPAFDGQDWDLGHAIFFGRLETRKGFDIFDQAVRAALNTKPFALTKVSFLGKDGGVSGPQGGGQPASAMIAQLRADYPHLEVEAHHDFDAERALEYIRTARGVCVMPSLLDNFPFVVLESMVNGHPFLATAIGGVPEYVDPDWLVPVQWRALANKFLAMRKTFARPPAHTYDRAAAVAAFAAMIDEPPPVMPVITAMPKVSICIPHYNYGRYLPQLLDALDVQDYPNFEMVLVDDGSTAEDSRETFRRLKAERESPTRRFIEKVNGGIGQTRNYAAREATGDYLIFVDADNVPVPTMISSLVTAILTSGADCVTGQYIGYPPDNLTSPTPDQAKVWYMPVGQALECGTIDNVFGDANCIIRKDVYWAIGGFTEDRGLSCEDWELFARLGVRGYRQEMIPVALQNYGITAEGASRTTSAYDNRLRALRPYFEVMPDWQRRLTRDAAVAAQFTLNSQRRQIATLFDQLYELKQLHDKQQRS